MTLDQILKNSLSYCDPALKKKFHSTAKKFLKELAKQIGLKPEDYDLRSNMGGIAVSGEITLHSDKLYIQICQGCGVGNVMYRSCKGRKDYSGGCNNWCKNVEDLYLPEVQAIIKRIINR